MGREEQNDYKLLINTEDNDSDNEDRNDKTEEQINKPVNSTTSIFAKVGSACFYGISSILIVFVNKILLTNLKFPSFIWIGIGQMLMTIVLLFFGRLFRFVDFPRLNSSIPRRIFPLPLFYVLNLLSGLGAIFFSPLLLYPSNVHSFAEVFDFDDDGARIFNNWFRTKPTFAVKVSVFLMIFGTFVAAMNDLTFDALGYTLIFINDIFTAANGVYVKEKLNAKHLGKYGVLFYNSLFMLLPTVLIAVLFTDDHEKIFDYIEDRGLNISVVACFMLSCVCGFILNYSLVICSTYNSALTTTCVGPIKNLIVTYGGMISSGDYIFNFFNFLGVNISVLGSILYTYVTFRSSDKAPKAATSCRN